MRRFEGRVVLITGAGSGIGQATVVRLLGEGAKIIAVDISEAGLAETRNKAEKSMHSDQLECVVVDVSDEVLVTKLLTPIIESAGKLDVLVNAAGILRSEHTHKTSLELWNLMLKTNLTSTFLVTRLCLPYLLETGHGVVVNFSSTSASFGHPYMAAYAATKGGIQAFTHAIAVEYAKQGLRAVAVAPGSIDTNMARAPGLPKDADLSLFAKMTPALGSGFGGADSVAGVVAMLASDDGKFVTGTELRIDGGTHM